MRYNMKFPVRVQRRASSRPFASVAFVSNLYPHPSASAAGVRTSFMLHRFIDDPSVDRVHYLIGATQNDSIEKEYPRVVFHQVRPNDTPGMALVLKEIGPDLSLVIFDRFYSEEAYSFHVREHCPNAIRVLDMQDMHSLRLGRGDVIQSKRDTVGTNVENPFDRLNESIQFEPTPQNDILLRELASLHRSDMVLVCAPHERALLEKCGLARHKLISASFWIDQVKAVQPNSFTSRANFMFIGGFKHSPNSDAAKVLATEIWPKIHEVLPKASLSIYGAFCPPHLTETFQSVPNLFIRGFAPSLEDILTRYRVMLAPLRFGAGIKGKIVDAWRFGMPVVATGIGSEGMTNSSDDWGGIIANTVQGFVKSAVDLYTNQPEWEKTSQQGSKLLRELFPVAGWEHIMEQLNYAIRHRDELRSKDFQGAVLWHQTARSTEYFSRWIECKNKIVPTVVKDEV